MLLRSAGPRSPAFFPASRAALAAAAGLWPGSPIPDGGFVASWFPSPPSCCAVCPCCAIAAAVGAAAAPPPPPPRPPPPRPAWAICFAFFAITASRVRQPDDVGRLGRHVLPPDCRRGKCLEPVRPAHDPVVGGHAFLPEEPLMQMPRRNAKHRDVIERR